jgi:hypothetical protein
MEHALKILLENTNSGIRYLLFGQMSLLKKWSFFIPSPPFFKEKRGFEDLSHFGYFAVKGIIFCTPSAVKVAAPF